MIPGDNDEEVAARGILYLLIFQQLGQLVRWSWGYHVLLAPPSKPDEVTPNDSAGRRYRDDDGEEEDNLQQIHVDSFTSPQFESSLDRLRKFPTEREPLLFSPQRNHFRSHTSGTHDSAFDPGPPGARTPVSAYPSTTSLSTCHGSDSTEPSSIGTPVPRNYEVRDINSLPVAANLKPSDETVTPRWSLPKPSASGVFNAVKNGIVRFFMGLWEFMNPPLWAMLAAVIVASIPKLQELFFTEGTFINASVTRAVSQSGGVAVPLILVVLGANLANNASSTNTHASKVENKILFASLVSRMVLPFIFTAPVLALAAKYLSITILDDPIFLIVCFLLTGAPSALQLAQICQINQVYEDVITRVLFWSYVVVILPSTLVLVITAIEVVHWAV
jgi:predicted permease